MSTNESTKKTPPITVEEILRDRRRRLEAAVTPQGLGSGGWRERFASRPSDFPLQPCDFKKWLKYDSLPIEQACFVLLGFEPPPLHVLRFVQDNYNPSPEPTWDAPPEYADVRDSLRVSIARGNISVHRIREGQYQTSQASWPDLVRWARSKDYPIAPELETIVAKMEPVGVAVTVPVAAPVMSASDAYTLADAAQAIAAQLGWHDGARDTLTKQMMQAASDGTLPVRHPHTDLPYKPGTGRDFYELVTPIDVNAWLEKQGAPYRWNVAAPATEAGAVLPAAASETATPAPVVTVGASDGAEQGLTTKEIASAFDGVCGWPADRWIKNLSAAKWAASALIGLGEQGGAPSVWRPLTLAQLIHGRTKAGKAKSDTLTLLHTRFNRQAALAPWRDAFNEFFATFSDAD